MMNKFIPFILLSIILSSCSFRAKRDSRQESDDLSMKITDKWVAEDTRLTVNEIIQQLKNHKGWQRYVATKSSQPKLFIAEVQNNTDEAYFPIADFNDEFLYNLSASGEFRLVDAAAREKILEEITYQNDGMVDPNQAKTIGKQLGADIMVFGSVNMRPHKRDGKSLRQYSVNLRFTDIEKAEEIARMRHRVYKSSDKSSLGW